MSRNQPVKLQYTHSNRETLVSRSNELVDRVLNDDSVREEIQEMRNELSKSRDSFMADRSAGAFSERDESERLEKPTLPFRSTSFSSRPTLVRFDDLPEKTGANRFSVISEEA